MKKGTWALSRRGFIKVAGLTCGYALLGLRTAKETVASVLDLVGIRQQAVYKADADKRLYKLRKSQDNPMVKKLYAKGGFLEEGPCGHNSHELLHTHYKDRSALIADLKKKGVELAM